MKIFLDIGAHVGETLEAVIGYDYDRIYAFEPCKVSADYIKYVYTDKRITVNNFGLFNANCEKEMYASGSDGASLYKDKSIWQPHHDINNIEKCKFVKASDWFKANIKTEDIVVLKFNCEGSEGYIINDLLDNKQWHKVFFAFIDFDCRWHESLQHQRKETITKLIKLKFHNWADETLMTQGGTHKDRTEAWMNTVEWLIEHKIRLK
jgi:FkbM family methyltransferase